MRNAMTMIELVFVLVVLGIVASLGAEMIANAYKSYFLQHITHRANMRTEIAAQQITNLLAQRVPGTTLSRNPNNLNDSLSVKEFTVANDTTHTLLEWIATEEESFYAKKKPGWNGFCDVDASSGTTVKTPGSKLNFTWTVMANLFPGMGSPAIFFNSDQYDMTHNYDVNACMGIVDNNTSCISSVSKVNQTTLQFDSPFDTRPQKYLSEHYKLAATAYALCPKDNGDGTFDLILFYDYQPWEGERLSQTNCGDVNSTNISHATLVTDLTVFKFAEAGNTFRFKICTREKLGEGDHNITSCKERAVIR